MEIQVLERQGKGVRAIARITGLSRNTVRTVLRGEHDGHYGPRPPRETKLDPFKPLLQARIDAAGTIHLPATVLLREIRAAGYAGGITQLKEFVRSIRPVAPAAPVVRFETAPGYQLQIDFVVFRRGASPLRAFTAELGYSRYAYVEFTDNERSETLVACLERALQFFGGVPEHVLVRQSQDDRDPARRVRGGTASVQCRIAGLRQALRCAGEVVRAVSSADQGQSGAISPLFARIVLSTRSQARLQPNSSTSRRQIAKYVPGSSEVANCRIHATLKERPVDRFAVEERRASARFAACRTPVGRRTRRDPAMVTTPVPVESFSIRSRCTIAWPRRLRHDRTRPRRRAVPTPGTGDDGHAPRARCPRCST